MAYRGERTTERASDAYNPQDEQARNQPDEERGADWRGVDWRAPAGAASAPADATPAPDVVAPAYPSLWPPDERPLPPADSAGSAHHTSAPDALTEAETARIPTPSAFAEAETARIPAPTGRPSAVPLPIPPADAFPGAPTASPGNPFALSGEPGEPVDGLAPVPGRGLADLPTARIPTAGPILTPAAPGVAPLPPFEPIWNAPTAPLAPNSPFAAPPVESAPGPTRPPHLEPMYEPAPVRAARWGAPETPAWAAPERTVAPSTPLTPRAPAPSLAPGAASGRRVTPLPNARVAPAPQWSTGAPGPLPTTPGIAGDADNEAPSAHKTPRRAGGLALRLAVFALLGMLLLAVVGVGGAYGYGVSQSGAPQLAIGAYCDALRQANYAAAYNLLTPAAQAHIPRQQYVTDGQARDAFYGRVSVCQTQLLGADGRFIFWRQPTLVVYALTLDRAGVAGAHTAPDAATGHVALSPDGARWRISAVDASLLGIDLDPLTVVSDFCQALTARDYTRAYGDLSPPFQHEQTSASAFAKAFGAVGKVTSCADQLSTYKVGADDRSATLALTLGVSGALPGASATTVAFTMPATMMLVRTAQGWRIDGLTLGAPTPQG